MASRGLTPKQEKFCNEYFKTGNASEAYRRSYNCANMKETTISRNAFTLLENNKITAKVEELKATLEKKTIITKERVVEILASIGEGADRDSDKVAALKQICKVFGWETTTSVIEFNKNATAPMDKLMGTAEGK